MVICHPAKGDLPQNSIIPTGAERSERSGGTCFFGRERESRFLHSPVDCFADQL